MFRTAYQRGFLTVFFSCGSKPLELWEPHLENGHIQRLLDPDIKSMVLDIRGNNVSTVYMTCPPKNKILGITMPFMILVVKNLKKYFTFEVTILDDTGTRRRFRVSNFQSTTQILPMSTAMPIGLADGWNQIQFNLSEFTRRAYGKAFVEVQKIKVNANIRIRRIYFAEKLTAEEDLPPEYRIFLPLPAKGKGKKLEVIKEAPGQPKPDEPPLKTTSRTSVVNVPGGPPPPPAEQTGPPAAEPPATEPPPAETAEPVATGESTPVTEEPLSAVSEATPGESELPEGGTIDGAPTESEAGTEQAAEATEAALAEEAPAEAAAAPAEAAVDPAEAAADPAEAAADPAEAAADPAEAAADPAEAAAAPAE